MNRSKKYKIHPLSNDIEPLRKTIESIDRREQLETGNVFYSRKLFFLPGQAWATVLTGLFIYGSGSAVLRGEASTDPGVIGLHVWTVIITLCWAVMLQNFFQTQYIAILTSGILVKKNKKDVLYLKYAEIDGLSLCTEGGGFLKIFLFLMHGIVALFVPDKIMQTAVVKAYVQRGLIYDCVRIPIGDLKIPVQAFPEMETMWRNNRAHNDDGRGENAG
jgi:hypothetical protein